MTAFARFICTAIVVGLTGFFLYALATGNVGGDASHTWQMVWGIYVSVDVYCGFLLIATLIYAYERKVGLTFLIFIVTCWTDKMVPTAWLLWRAPDIYRRIANSKEGARA